MEKCLSALNFKRKIKNEPYVLLPIGSFEQHGPAGDLRTDAVIAQYVANEMAKEFQMICLPLLAYGYSEVHINFPGTINISADVYRNLFGEICDSLFRNNVKKIFVINGHGGNIIPVKQYVESEKRIVWIEWFQITGTTFFEIEHKSHAGSEELSVLKAINEAYVEDEKIENMIVADVMTKRKPARMEDYSLNGVLGKADGFNKEIGAKILEYVINQVSAKLSEIICEGVARDS